MADLVADNLSRSYPSGESQLHVLEGVSLEMTAGESLAIVGPSGSGKSTLLSILGTLESPTGGTLQLAGSDPFRLSEKELAAFRSQHIGFVFQDHHLLPQCTVLENVLVPFLADGVARTEQVERARQLITGVGLAQRSLHRPAQLSGGERQRVAIARALVREPQLILADEPTGNLDAHTAEEITSLLLRLQAESEAMLIAVTHSEVLAGRMQRHARLENGGLVEVD